MISKLMQRLTLALFLGAGLSLSFISLSRAEYPNLDQKYWAEVDSHACFTGGGICEIKYSKKDMCAPRGTTLAYMVVGDPKGANQAAPWYLAMGVSCGVKYHKSWGFWHPTTIPCGPPQAEASEAC